jgi:hypothetical protein
MYFSVTLAPLPHARQELNSLAGPERETEDDAMMGTDSEDDNEERESGETIAEEQAELSDENEAATADDMAGNLQQMSLEKDE